MESERAREYIKGHYGMFSCVEVLYAVELAEFELTRAYATEQKNMETKMVEALREYLSKTSLKYVSAKIITGFMASLNERRMKKIIKHGHTADKAVYQHECRNCGCQFEFKRADVDSTYYDQRDYTNYWYVACPECGNKTGFDEPKPIRYKK